MIKKQYRPLYLVIMLWINICYGTVQATNTTEAITYKAQTQSSIETEQIARINRYQQAKKELQSIGINYFIGELNTTMPVAVKLPIFDRIEKNTYSFEQTFGQIIVSYNKPNDKNYFGQRSYTSYFFTNQPQDTFNFESWLASEVVIPEAILYKESDGVIYYDSEDELRAFRYLYDEKQQQYIFAKASVWKGTKPEESLAKIAQGYAILKTVNNPHAMGTLIDTNLLNLTPKQYFKHFKYRFDIQTAQTLLLEKLNNLLQFKPLLSQSAGGIELGVPGSYGKSWIGYLKVTVKKQPIEQLQQQLLIDAKKYEGMSTYNPVYNVIYQTKDAIIFQNEHISQDRYTYYFIEDNGLVYQLYYHPDYDYDELLNHIHMVQALRQIGNVKLNHYDKTILDQIGLYKNIKELTIGNQQLYIVEKDENNISYWAVLNQNGQIVIDFSTNEIIRIGEALAMIEKESKNHTLYDTKGNVILEKISGYINPSKGSVVEVCTESSPGECKLFDTQKKQWVDIAK